MVKEIYSENQFVVLSKAYAILSVAAANDPNWQIAPRCAVGAKAGETQINISENSQSSSLLPILEQHTKSAPESHYIGTETIAVVTLDECKFIGPGERVFVKVDTQGFEQSVVDGARNLLKSAIGIQLEISFAPLYSGQGNFMRLISQIQDLGFSVWSFNPGFSDPATARTLQGDVTLFRD